MKPNCHNLIRSTGLLALVLFYCGCANQVAPTGGPKDVIAPEVLAVQPPNLSTNFKDGQITIKFDEFIQLNNPGQQILISPPMSVAPQCRVKGKRLIINLPDESLRDSTTYISNFGEAVVDYNESNKIRNLNYVFSTGPVVDSLSVGGSMLNVMTGEAAEETTR